MAKQNGQSQRHVLEEALAYYLHNVVPSQRLVRPDVMHAFDQSVERNRELMERLAREMAEVYLTVAEEHQMQHILVDRFGGLHGVRDKGAIESAVFRHPRRAITTPWKKKPLP